jgi:hypothetical protein
MPSLDMDNQGPPKSSLPRVGPKGARRVRSGSAGQNGVHSTMMASHRVTMVAIARSLKGGDCAVLGRSTAAASEGIGVTAHRIPTRKMPQKPPRIPPPARGMWDSQTQGRLRALPPS